MAHVPAAERRPQLVQAAIDLMAREGVDAGSTRAIAAELGVAQATVHYTFGTKRDLYRAVIEQLTAELVELVRRAAPDGPHFEESLRLMAGALWQGLRQQPGRYLLFIELTTYALRNPELHEVLRAHQSDLEQTAAKMISDVAERAERPLAAPPVTLARFFLAGFDGLALRHLVIDDDASATGLEHLVAATLALAGEGRAATGAVFSTPAPRA
ncbi:AcrR family transcriptional regulator [Streptomyces olivoverticillatus]|uniref:AcrR family transcriptional regulator n=1 Tax=Streptomyces olivoverticillatus TaxID=66427 RepID=A0A7W7PMN4_9ACTN|nr:TetR family transcriptional regulator [Streptomyces olivoverticillatus]MBB4895517.1 AcrR family transcriptional regulator [Streptomyces olivoverticillatus]